MRLEEYLVKNELITDTEATTALDCQRDSRPPIGVLAIREGKMRPCDVRTVLLWQRIDRVAHFGEIALDFGFLSDRDIDDLLRAQARETEPLLKILTRMGVVHPAEVEAIEADYQRASTIPPGAAIPLWPDSSNWDGVITRKYVMPSKPKVEED